MHDPLTVCWDLRIPFTRRTLITVWHKDPEADGSDDSCGWFRPNLSKKQRERCKSAAWREAREPWFRRARCKSYDRPADVESLARGAYLFVARVIRVRLSIAAATRLACEMVHNPDDGGRSSFCLLPGWHTNSKDDTEYWREQSATDLFCGLARNILRHKRHWWQHPRWHVWHWRIQFHPLQQFKRWAFSRCCKCEKGFTWGYSPVTCNWNSKGPRWFRSEPDIMHHECCPPCSKPTQQLVETINEGETP